MVSLQEFLSGISEAWTTRKEREKETNKLTQRETDRETEVWVGTGRKRFVYIKIIDFCLLKKTLNKVNV